MPFLQERLPKCEKKFWKALKKWEKTAKKKPDDVNAYDRAMTDWVTPFCEERLRGHAILQRRRRLMQLQSTQPKETPQECQETPPEYSDACALSEAERTNELRTLLAAFWESNANLLSKTINSPMINAAQFAVMLHTHKDRNGRSFFWVKDRTKCADSGGCCGRPCKCCEKPLLVYDRPPDFWEPLEESGVYSHCTSECPCCIALKQEYTLHPNLPPTGLLLENK